MDAAHNHVASGFRSDLMIDALRSSPPLFGSTQSLLHAVRLFAPLARNLRGRQGLILLNEAGSACRSFHQNAIRIIEKAFSAIGVGGIDMIRQSAVAPTSFEHLLSQRISAALSYRYDHWSNDEDMDEALAMLEAFDFEQPMQRGRHQLLDMGSGLQVSTYTSISPGKPPVLMVLPCGMPFGLCGAWFDLLSQNHSVLTWESRGLFGAAPDMNLELDLDSQLADLFGLLDQYGASQVHVMGFCGGAVLAMRAIQRQPERFHSMSLWYGDYHVADHRLRTHHQKNFDWLMAEAGESRTQALELHKMFADPSILSTVPEMIAHWVLYPYANPELLYRYAKLNFCLNNEDVTTSLTELKLPVLVVAGDSDSTTDSGASEYVAARLPQARFELERNGNHQEFFSAPKRSCELALNFLSEQFQKNHTGIECGWRNFS